MAAGGSDVDRGGGRCGISDSDSEAAGAFLGNITHLTLPRNSSGWRMRRCHAFYLKHSFKVLVMCLVSQERNSIFLMKHFGSVKGEFLE